LNTFFSDAGAGPLAEIIYQSTMAFVRWVTAQLAGMVYSNKTETIIGPVFIALGHITVFD
jgi:hypothetical protein